MKLEPWEPDLRTLVARIDEDELDLQPEFQRGLAWSPSKQQRLIDTILRGWSVPPLHLLVLPEQRLAVLDGQQRLRAIVAFLEGNLKVGRWDPHDEDISAYVGMTYRELPEAVQRRVQNFKLSCYRLYEYRPEEPYELFFRLNQPTGLTQAEKRNALVGDSRRQVKELAGMAEALGWSSETIGFANARMAYDDTIARACCYVEARSLRIPLTSGELEAQYRRPGGFSDGTMSVLSQAVAQLTETLIGDRDGPALNKATLLTWLLAHCRRVLDKTLRAVDLNLVLPTVERGRAAVRRPDNEARRPAALAELNAAWPYLELYNDRASSRVTDVLSVVTRDAVVWRIADLLQPAAVAGGPARELIDRLASFEGAVDDVEWRTVQLLEDSAFWGQLA